MLYAEPRYAGGPLHPQGTSSCLLNAGGIMQYVFSSVSCRCAQSPQRTKPKLVETKDGLGALQSAQAALHGTAWICCRKLPSAASFSWPASL